MENASVWSEKNAKKDPNGPLSLSVASATLDPDGEKRVVLMACMMMNIVDRWIIRGGLIQEGEFVTWFGEGKMLRGSKGSMREDWDNATWACAYPPMIT